ncbi:MAG: bifunctional riboflavin kinase/FAD synthetase [Halieaceae bacterium]|jgi:riboflavin kinase/FMN adenylyltransferase|nr:bifunctional riboflavin kinase/FAD synthetase [Halieaceae bacterium]
MELLRGLGGLRDRHRPCVATIGAFDGVHLGHQAVVAQTDELARALGLPTTVVTFEPLPREYLAGADAPPRLQSFRARFEAFRGLGVDRMLCLRFNERLRSMSADDFARQLFIDGLGIRALVLGDDFRFGRAREGDAAFMHALGQREGFETHAMRTVEVGGERVSSTRLRRALAEGDFELAEALLGRPWTISGRVMHGRRLGRELGAPTANIALRHRSLPVSGVFIVRVSGAGLENAPAIANVGTRPTIAAGQRANLEVHVLEGNPELYGQRLDIQFVARIRDEQRFDGVEALREQIHRDIDAARAYFAAAPTTAAG